MENITIGQAQRMAAPNPFALLSVLRDDGVTNLMALSWWTFLSNHPAMIGVCLSKKGLSGSLIEKQGEFGLSIVGEELREAARLCGGCSGRTENKAEKFGIGLEAAEAIKAQVVAGSRIIFECRLQDKIEASDHVFYTAEVIRVRGDSSVKQLFAWDGYSRLDPV